MCIHSKPQEHLNVLKDSTVSEAEAESVAVAVAVVVVFLFGRVVGATEQRT